MRYLLTLALFISLTFPTLAARPYHLELEANPAAAFPYLGKFGAVTLHVYPSGVRAEALWLNGFSRNGEPNVTVVNPLGRMYVEMPVADIAPALNKLAGGAAGVEALAVPQGTTTTRGKVAGVDATRHRIEYGPNAWIDYWTTTVIPENPQLRRLARQFVRGVSPGTADVVDEIGGTPLYVELNFRRFRKLPLLKVKKLTFSAKGEEDALTLGRLYVRAGALEKLLGIR